MLKELKCAWHVQIKFLLVNEMANTFEYHLNRQVINLMMRVSCIRQGAQRREPGKQNANVLLVCDWKSYSLITSYRGLAPRAKVFAERS